MGYSIGFDYMHLYVLAEQQQCRIVPCIYEEADHYGVMEQLITLGGRRVNDGQFDRAVNTFFYHFRIIAPAIKHPSFAEEREWRVVMEEKSENPVAPRFRPGPSMLVPFTELRLASEEERIRVSHVVVGPNPHMKLSLASVENLLTQSARNGWKVTPSSVPFRSW